MKPTTQRPPSDLLFENYQNKPHSQKNYKCRWVHHKWRLLRTQAAIGSWVCLKIALNNTKEQLTKAEYNEFTALCSCQSCFDISPAPVGSIMIHKFGHRVTMLIGGVIAALGLFICSFAPNIYIVLVSFGISGEFCCLELNTQ